MKKYFLNFTTACILIALLFIFSGCSGKSGAGSSGGASSLSTGNLTMSFNYPPKGKYIPSNTSTIQISITGSGLSSASVTTVNYGTTSVTITNLPLGNKTAQISSLDSMGNVLTIGNITFIIEAGKTVSSSATLGISFNDSGFTPSTLTIPTNNWLCFYNNSSNPHNIIFSGVNAVYNIPANSTQSIYLDSSGSFNIYLDSTSGASMSLAVQNSPQILSISPASGAVGSFVTITGVNFGATQGASTVKFNGTSATAITSWSATEIACAVPTGAVTGNIVVTVGGIASNGVSFTVTSSGPQILSLNPVSGTVGTTVTITGNNFGSSQGLSTVKFNGTTATLITSWAAGQVVCKVPNGAATGNVIVTVGGVDSNGFSFTVSAPSPVAWSTEWMGVGASIQSVWGTAANDIFAVGNSGKIIHYDGTKWSEMTSPTAQTLYYVWGMASNDVFAVGNAGTIIHYDGSSWSAQASGTAQNLFCVYGTASNNVFAVGNTGANRHYDGTSWGDGPIADGNNFYSVFAASSSVLYIGGGNWRFYKTINGGVGWANVSTAPTPATVWGLWASGPDDVFLICGSNGLVLHYDGLSVTSFGDVTGATAFVNDGWGTSGSNVYVVANNGGIYNYNGAAWSGTIPSSNAMYGIWGLLANNIYAVGASSTILNYNGTSWNDMTAQDNANHMLGVWGVDENDIFAVGFSGTIIRKQNGGNWVKMISGTSDDFRGVWGTNASNVFAVGENGTIKRFDGASWSAMASPTVDTLMGIWGTSTSDIFITDNAGKVWHYDGAAWSEQLSVALTSMRGIWGTAGNDVFAVGNSGKIYHYDGSSWSLQASGTASTLYGVWGTAWNDVFVAGESGKILHYNGAAWSSQVSGTADTLQSIWGTESGNVYAGGLSGTMLRYNGTAWSAQVSGITQDIGSIWGSGSANIYAAATSGKIIRGQ